MTTAILGMRGTGSFPANQLPGDWRTRYLMLEPNGSAPLTAMLSMLKSEATKDPKFNNFRKEKPTLSFKLAAGINTSVTTLTADTAENLSYFRPGMLIRNFRTGEVMKITAKPTDTTVTVTRGIGASNVGIAGLTNDVIFNVGNSNPEGADTPQSITFDTDDYFNYTQIIRTPLEITGTALNTEFRTGPKYQELVNDTTKLHMEQLERAFLFGKRELITGANGQAERMTGGIISQLTTNVLDLNSASTPGVLTEKDFDTFLAQYVFAYGASKEKLALCGWQVAQNLHEIAKDRWVITNAADRAYGIDVMQYRTGFGTLNVVTHPLFRQIAGMEKAMLIVDTQDVVYRYMQNRDTKLLTDRQNPGRDGKIDEFMTEAGLELLQEKTHAYITNWASIA